mmetsp:Transcript_1739/g.3562  ORF Transcript_1739/g.3562 Transcript_1739/m.3562 type:complete len:252 (-) Transcript_1739:162-917(-)
MHPLANRAGANFLLVTGGPDRHNVVRVDLYQRNAHPVESRHCALGRFGRAAKRAHVGKDGEGANRASEVGYGGGRVTTEEREGDSLGPQGALGLGKALEHEVVYAAVGDVAVRVGEVESHDHGHALLPRQLPCIEQRPVILRALLSAHPVQHRLAVGKRRSRGEQPAALGLVPRWLVATTWKAGQGLTAGGVPSAADHRVTRHPVYRRHRPLGTATVARAPRDRYGAALAHGAGGARKTEGGSGDEGRREQ